MTVLWIHEANFTAYLVSVFMVRNLSTSVTHCQSWLEPKSPPLCGFHVGLLYSHSYFHISITFPKLYNHRWLLCGTYSCHRWYVRLRKFQKCMFNITHIYRPSTLCTIEAYFLNRNMNRNNQLIFLFLFLSGVTVMSNCRLCREYVIPLLLHIDHLLKGVSNKSHGINNYYSMADFVLEYNSLQK